MDAPALANLAAWSLQAAVVLIAGGTLPWALRLHHPRARHAWWRALLAGCLLLPLLQPWHGVSLPPGAATGDLRLLTGALPADGPSSVLSVIVVGVPGTRWPAILTWILVLGAAARLGYLGAGVRRLQRLRRASLAATDEDAAAQAGVEIRYGSDLGQPVTFGLRRPVILLPLALRSQPLPIRRAVIEHELWHVRRGDWRWLVAEECVRAVLWFHPGITWAISQIQRTREEVVDQLTVRSTSSRRHYLEALLAFADAPPLHPAAPFARRRHLFHRMVLISREAAMSSKRTIATCVAMTGAVLIGGWYGVSAFPLASRPVPPAESAQSTQTRDRRPGEAGPPTAREQELRQTVAAEPSLEGYLDLAKMQESRGALPDAEDTLQQAVAALPDAAAAMQALGRFYSRNGRPDMAMHTLHQLAAARPGDPGAQHLAAAFAEEQLRQNPNLTASQRLELIDAALADEDRALAIAPDYFDALVIKSVLLRHKAGIASDTALRAQLVAEADTLRQRGMAVRQANPGPVRYGGNMPGQAPPPPPPPPPPPSAFEGVMVDGQMPVHIGGEIKPPSKLKNVAARYPPEALAAKVQGVVILELLVDAQGTVRDLKVMRSVPMLDEAAMEAVRQWTFTPTLLNGNPVPVLLTVTVNFTLR
jgi:TonB family protein